MNAIKTKREFKWFDFCFIKIKRTFRSNNNIKGEIKKMKKIGMTLALLMTVLLIGSTNATADDFRCTGAVGEATLENVIVPSGASCTLTRTRVQGNIFVERGASLNTRGARVGGSIQSEGFNSIVVQGGTRVTGSVQLKRAALRPSHVRASTATCSSRKITALRPPVF